MRRGERGATIIELVVAITIMALVSGAATAATFQVFKCTERNSEYMTALNQVQNAAYWISHDAQMAQSITTENLTSPDFLVLNWTEWDAEDNPVYHSATYFWEDLSGGIGKLKRSHWSSAGVNEQTLVARHIYYDPTDLDYTSEASYQNPVLTLQITALSGESRETREYQISRRPNF
ncbi:MAG: prepilin-type N-terminal cleavage/methylation domain-containing protein [Dehalococcoidia bacterium]|nr:MAG: prepilin-type N-terminal cleavage/methylation domain-containing protein [Dehalococcoidia bacterium]